MLLPLSLCPALFCVCDPLITCCYQSFWGEVRRVMDNPSNSPPADGLCSRAGIISPELETALMRHPLHPISPSGSTQNISCTAQLLRECQTNLRGTGLGNSGKLDCLSAVDSQHSDQLSTQSQLNQFEPYDDSMSENRFPAHLPPGVIRTAPNGGTQRYQTPPPQKTKAAVSHQPPVNHQATASSPAAARTTGLTEEIRQQVEKEMAREMCREMKRRREKEDAALIEANGESQQFQLLQLQEEVHELQSEVQWLNGELSAVQSEECRRCQDLSRDQIQAEETATLHQIVIVALKAENSELKIQNSEIVALKAENAELRCIKGPSQRAERERQCKAEQIFLLQNHLDELQRENNDLIACRAADEVARRADDDARCTRLEIKCSGLEAQVVRLKQTVNEMQLINADRQVEIKRLKKAQARNADVPQPDREYSGKIMGSPKLTVHQLARLTQ